MKKTKLYLLEMQGQGDVEIKFVGKDVWDWMSKPSSKCPESIQTRHKEYLDGDENYEPLEVDSKSGSAVNDIALMVPPVKIGKIDAVFFSIKEAMAFVKKHNIEIVEEWSGYIY